HFSGQGARPAGAVREGKWKLIENYETGGTELFNLAEDISEKNDLKFSHPEKAQQLYSMLKNWRTEVDAKMPQRKAGYR
ncbi:MAG: sulfatase, partial [Bacteroidota bacterium]